MSSDVIDNQRVKLATRVRDLLAEGAVSAHFAVGYLFLDGLVPLRAELDRLDHVQILIGNVVNRLTDEQVREEAESRLPWGDESANLSARDQDNFAATLRETHTLAAATMALNLRRTISEMPRDDQSGALLITLAKRIADGAVKVRLYTGGRIHAKMVLVGYPDRHPIAIVGSSNLTLGGPAHPTEMNVVVRDPESVVELREWYAGLWDTAQDFHRELFEELGQCWAMRLAPAGGGGIGR